VTCAAGNRDECAEDGEAPVEQRESLWRQGSAIIHRRGLDSPPNVRFVGPIR
jgi:hypothetical protein